jgi:hypothetical protein
MKKAAPVLAASEKRVKTAGSSILGSAGTGSPPGCAPVEAAARMAEEEVPPRHGRAADSYLADEMDKACPAWGCPNPREAAAAAGTEEERLPRGPAGGERSEMPWEVSAIAARWRCRRGGEKAEEEGRGREGAFLTCLGALG